MKVPLPPVYSPRPVRKPKKKVEMKDKQIGVSFKVEKKDKEVGVSFKVEKEDKGIGIKVEKEDKGIGIKVEKEEKEVQKDEEAIEMVTIDVQTPPLKETGYIEKVKTSFFSSLLFIDELCARSSKRTVVYFASNCM